MPVAGSFGTARDAVVAAVDAKFSEEVRLSPFKGKQPDATRAQITINAVLRTGDQEAGPLDGVGARRFHSRIAANKAVLYIDRTMHPDIKLVKGDAVRAMERPGKPAFEVATVDDRNHARLVIGLNQA